MGGGAAQAAEAVVEVEEVLAMLEVLMLTQDEAAHFPLCRAARLFWCLELRARNKAQDGAAAHESGVPGALENGSKRGMQGEAPRRQRQCA